MSKIAVSNMKLDPAKNIWAKVRPFNLLITKHLGNIHFKLPPMLRADPNIIYALGHLIDYRKFTGENDIRVKIQKSSCELKITAQFKGHILVGNYDKNDTLHFLRLGVVDSLNGRLLIESEGRGLMCFLKGDTREQGSFISYIKDTLITILIPHQQI